MLMSNFIGNHEITNVTFTKGTSCISIVGPALGSGANGETVALLKSDEVDTSKKIEFITKAMTQLKKGDESIAEDLLNSLNELKESLESSNETIEDEQAEVVEPTEGDPLESADDNNPGVSTIDVVSGDPSATTEAVSVVASEPQPSLVIKSKKGNKEMSKEVELTVEQKYEALVKANEAKDAKLDKLLKAEEARTFEACLNKAKGVAHAIGEDAIEPLAKALMAIEGVETMEPLLKALEAVSDYETNKDQLNKSAGHSLEGEDTSSLSVDQKIDKEFDRLVKATKDAGESVNFKAILAEAKSNIQG